MLPEASRLYRLGAFACGVGYGTVAAMTRQLDRTMAARGWALLVFHGLDRREPFSIPAEAFGEILAHVDALDVDVLAVGDVIRACDRWTAT